MSITWIAITIKMSMRCQLLRRVCFWFCDVCIQSIFVKSNHQFIISFLYLTLLQDISDLFGADLPVEGGKSGEFAWRDGPFLAALRSGDWIVLDEVLLKKIYFIHEYNQSKLLSFDVVLKTWVF